MAPISKYISVSILSLHRCWTRKQLCEVSKVNVKMHIVIVYAVYDVLHHSSRLRMTFPHKRIIVFNLQYAQQFCNVFTNLYYV